MPKSGRHTSTRSWLGFLTDRRTHTQTHTHGDHNTWHRTGKILSWDQTVWSLASTVPAAGKVTVGLTVSYGSQPHGLWPGHLLACLWDCMGSAPALTLVTYRLWEYLYLFMFGVYLGCPEIALDCSYAALESWCAAHSILTLSIWQRRDI